MRQCDTKRLARVSEHLKKAVELLDKVTDMDKDLTAKQRMDIGYYRYEIFRLAGDVDLTVEFASNET